MDPSEAIAMFISITGADHESAVQYLEMCDYNAENAVSLFLDGGAQSVPSKSNSSSKPSAFLPSDFDDDDGVRAPMQIHKTQRLVDAPSSYRPAAVQQHIGFNPTMPTPQLFNDFQSSSAKRSVPPPASASSKLSSSASDKRSKGYADLFRPPTDIMFAGDYYAAMRAATEQKRWLLVNIQGNEGDFESMCLNRDVWGSDIIKEIIQKNFIFLQFLASSEGGKKFSGYQGVTKTPHVSLIDPRSGESVRKFEGHIEADDFIEALYEVMEIRSLEDDAAVPSPEKKSSSSSSSASSAKPVVEPEFIFEDDDEEYDQGEGEQYEEEEEEEEEPTKSAPVVSVPSKPVLSPETASFVAADSDSSASRVQIRWPNSSREVVKFKPSMPLSALHQWCEFRLSEQGLPYKNVALRLFNTVVPNHDSQTIQEAGVAGAAIQVSSE